MTSEVYGNIFLVNTDLAHPVSHSLAEPLEPAPFDLDSFVAAHLEAGEPIAMTVPLEAIRVDR
jgi:hypothetical protein